MSFSCYWLLRSNPSPFELVFASHLNLSPASVVASSRGRDLSRADAQRRLSLRRRAQPRWRVTPLRPGLRPGTQAGRAPSGATIPVGEISWIRNREPARFPGPSTSARTDPEVTPERATTHYCSPTGGGAAARTRVATASEREELRRRTRQPLSLCPGDAAIWRRRRTGQLRR